MKKQYFYILILGLSLFGCDNMDKPKIDSYKGNSIDEIIRNEIASGVKNDTIFLGFHFGMSESEFQQKLRQLIKGKKVYADNISGKYTYDLTARDNQVYKCTFSPDYFEGKLYEIGVSAKSANTYNTVQIDNSMLAIFFMQKYGLAAIQYESSFVDKCNDYIWIDGNRKIKLMCGLYSDNRIFYQDLTVLEKKENSEKKEFEKKRKESQSDI